MFSIVPRSLFIKLGWTTISYGAMQALRLVSNVILARLLAPSLFGLMLIVNTIRTGVELLSDVGIGQNIVRQELGDTPDFYDTAWTLQAIRGLCLGGACLLLARPAARLFDAPQLAQVLPAASLFFVFTGFESVSKFLLQKKLSVARLNLFEVIVLAAGIAVNIIFAVISPTIWALVLGSVFAGAVALVMSHMLMPGLRHRIILKRESLREMLRFGRWIFVSSMIYFAAMNFDRLYFAKQISLAELGVFGIARTLSDTISLFAMRCSSMILFPLVAAMQGPAPEIRAKLRRGRRTMLLAAAIGLALFTALADRIVHLLYDVRYADAGVMLPLLAIGAWFSILAGVNDTIVTAIGHPKWTAAANIAKLLTYVVGVPIALASSGLHAAIVVLSAGELVRYLVLWLLSRGQGLAFARDDLPITLMFLASILLFRGLLAGAGLTGGLVQLFPLAARLLA